MQSLGKVPSARRAPQPVNLPSLKSESGVVAPESSNSNSSNSSTSGGGGGSSGTVAPSTAPQSATPNSAGWTGSAQEAAASAPVVAGNKPPQSQSPAPVGVVPVSTGPVPTVAPAQPAIPVQPRQSTTFLERKFQQEFPSLTADSQVTGPPAKRAPAPQPPTVVAAPVPVSPSEIPRQESPQPLQYGPGPSLRPQTEGSWVQGGRPSNVSPSQGGSGNTSAEFFLSATQRYSRSFLFGFKGVVDGLAGQVAGVLPPGQAGPRGIPVHPGQIAGQPHALRSVMPPFMFRGGQIPPGNYPTGPYPGSGQYGPRGPGGPPGRYPPPPNQEARFRQGMRMANPAANQNDPDLYPRPIIKEEDLRRMDEISGDDGWAALQDEPDYDKKLDDDEPTEQQRNAQQTGASTTNAVAAAAAAAVEEESKADRDGKWADNIQAQGRAISTPPAQNVNTLNRDRGVDRGVAQIGGSGGGGPPLRHPHQQNNSRPISLDEDDFWREQQRQQKNVEIKAAQRAKEMRYCKRH